jgi:hypothetical protein
MDMKKIITSKWTKIFLFAVVANMVIACNENDEDFFDKNAIILSAETTETRANAGDFPNAIDGKAQVAIFAYTAKVFQNDNDFRIDHVIADIGDGDGSSYKLLWQEGKEQYWPDYKDDIVFTGYNPINLKHDNDQLEISLSTGEGNTPDVIVADIVRQNSNTPPIVNLSFRHVMSGLTILMKKPNAESPVRLHKTEITIEGSNTRNYDLKTGRWDNSEDNQKEGSTFVYYSAEDSMLLSSTEIVLNSTPLLFFPGMEQDVTLTVYKEIKGEVIPFSMRLSDIKDRFGNVVNILQQGKQATLLLSVEVEVEVEQPQPVELIIDGYFAQNWITITNPTITLQEQFRIEVGVQRNGVPDIETCKKISSIELAGYNNSYRIPLKPLEEGKTMVTNTLQELPAREDITAYQLIVHLNDGRSKEVPSWRYNYHYAIAEWNNVIEDLLIKAIERSLIIEIEGDALD